MTEITYRGRRAVVIENSDLRLTVLVEGGHVAEILHKPSGVNPLWTPPWPSIEPSTYDRAKHPEYGADAESRLLAGIMGHNLCLDVFGSVSPEEAAAGMTVHGEGSIVPYVIRGEGDGLTATATLPAAQLRFERTIRLGSVIAFTEIVENLSALDRPIAWTQHVTLGPPFLERGVTQFRAPGTRSKALATGEEFDWPRFGTRDLQLYTAAVKSGGYTTHLMDPHREQAFFTAFSPKTKLLFGYVWKRTDFPWLGIWEENHSRTTPPWNGNTMTRGMEFGASPMPETRREMIERRSLFGVPGYRWLPARGRAEVRYAAFARTAERIADVVAWNGRDGLQLS